MIETNPSSNATTVSIYLSRSFIVSNVRDSLVYVFGGLETMLLCIEFSSFHSSIRVRMYVINAAFHSALSFLICFCFLDS